MVLILLFSFFQFILGKVYFKETFYGDGWKDRWVQSKAVDEPDYYGRFRIHTGKWYGDAVADRGLRTVEEARHYVIAADFRESFDTNKKDLVIQYSVKFEEDLVDCVGAYLKFGEKKDLENLEDFGSDTDFSLMFGPDRCGTGEKIHFILKYKGKHYEWKRNIIPKNDVFTHVYTLVMKPNNRYEMFIDGKKEMQGNLEDHFDLPAVSKSMRDPNDQKPSDWVDNKYIIDESDVKPDDWDERKTIPDESAVRPEGWDDSEMGEWKAPEISNPDYKGTWKARKILNPEYKGKWKARRVKNVNYLEDKKYYRRTLEWVGMELWSMKPNTVIDNFLITDDIGYAKEIAQKIQVRKEKEKSLKDELKKKESERLTSEREKNLLRQRRDRELKEETKPQEEAAERERKARELARKKEAAKKEQARREEKQKKYLEEVEERERIERERCLKEGNCEDRVVDVGVEDEL